MHLTGKCYSWSAVMSIWGEGKTGGRGNLTPVNSTHEKVFPQDWITPAWGTCRGGREGGVWGQVYSVLGLLCHPLLNITCLTLSLWTDFLPRAPRPHTMAVVFMVKPTTHGSLTGKLCTTVAVMSFSLTSGLCCHMYSLSQTCVLVVANETLLHFYMFEVNTQWHARHGFQRRPVCSSGNLNLANFRLSVNQWVCCLRLCSALHKIKKQNYLDLTKHLLISKSSNCIYTLQWFYKWYNVIAILFSNFIQCIQYLNCHGNI